jgi:DNA-binding MarR family transcriptional regulator
LIEVPENKTPEMFEFFNEIGIISQLSSALFSKSLPNGMHVSHFSILNHLVRLGDGRTPVEIANAFQVTKATMTHSLGVLERLGFVSVEPNPKDGRSKLVKLTQQGHAFRNQAITIVVPAFQHILAEMDAEQLLDLLPHLRKLRQILDRAR